MSNINISPTEELIEEARNGKMFVLVDAPDRENEGDLVIPAQFATPDNINFMAKHGRGLICLALNEERCEQLNLPLMTAHNQSRHETAFTTSIEAREGVSTGISAHDRALTVSVAIDPKSGPADIASPGHVFPIKARKGGVLVRAGHTEAAVDISRLAGLNPSGVICEIMNDDGTMARMPELIDFAQKHHLKIGTIADLIAYRRRHDRFVRRVGETRFEHANYGEFRAIIFKNMMDDVEHLALVRGKIGGTDTPTLARMHKFHLGYDGLLAKGAKNAVIDRSLRLIRANGSGILVLLRDSSREGLLELVQTMDDNQKSNTTQSQPAELRDYGVGAQILLDLGVTSLDLISDTKKNVVGLKGYGIRIDAQRPLTMQEAREVG